MAQPLDKIKSGSVTCTVWTNERVFDGKKVDIKTFQINKNYKDKEGNWKATDSYGSRELADVIIVTQEAQRKHGLRE